MSFVTTPTTTSPASSRQIAAMRLDLPDPTGPPTPTRRARRSADKEALRSVGVAGRGELEAGGGGRWLGADRARVGRDLVRRRLDRRRELRHPARGLGGIEAE